MGICVGRLTRTESRSAQTEINPYCDFTNGELINARYQNYRPMSVHSRMNNPKSRNENVQLKNSIINDWKHPNRYDSSYMKSENTLGDIYGHNSFEIPRQRFDSMRNNGDSTPTRSGVWPINGSGDCNFVNQKKKKNTISQSRVQLNRDFDKSNLNLNINFSDEEENVTPRNNLFNENNNIRFEPKFQSQLPVSTVPDYMNTKTNNRKPSSQRNSTKPREMNRMKSSKKMLSQKIKLGNNNSNNYHSTTEDKVINNSINSGKQFHSSSLLDQDCYPIQYTFYVDDTDVCTKPFYDRRMVAIAKTCRCRIYFHAKADEMEKPLYYKGKPVRPVTITSPDMACLKRCLGSIDSQFPNFNCKAFLSLSS